MYASYDRLESKLSGQLQTNSKLVVQVRRPQWRIWKIARGSRASILFRDTILLNFQAVENGKLGTMCEVRTSIIFVVSVSSNLETWKTVTSHHSRFSEFVRYPGGYWWVGERSSFSISIYFDWDHGIAGFPADNTKVFNESLFKFSNGFYICQFNGRTRISNVCVLVCVLYRLM